MACEHPGCSNSAVTICTHHCRLSICRQHRLEHDHDLLSAFEQQLDDITLPVANLLRRSQLELKQSEERRQREIDRINHLCDQQLFSIEQRSKLAKSTADLIVIRREQLNKSKNGDSLLNRHDFEQMQNASDKIQQNLQEQHRLAAQLREQKGNLKLWPVSEQDNVPSQGSDIEYIELSDSENETPKNSGEVIMIDENDITEQEMRNDDDNEQEEDEPSSDKRRKKYYQKRNPMDTAQIRDICPLTRIGVFGLKATHNVPRLCPATDRRLHLYQHFRTTHRLESHIASKLVSAIRSGSDPATTQIFPQDNSLVIAQNIHCPFGDDASMMNTQYGIANTPCHSLLAPCSMRRHLRDMHHFTTSAIDKVIATLKSHGPIQQIHFDKNMFIAQA